MCLGIVRAGPACVAAKACVLLPAKEAMQRGKERLVTRQEPLGGITVCRDLQD